VSLHLLDRGERKDAGDAGVDPRIQARRDEVSREQQRRRRRRLVAVGAVVAALAVAFGLSHSAAFDVDEVVVAATPHVSADEVMEAGRLRVGQNLVDVDTGAVRSRLRALPWVADARVDLDWWAGVVRVTITERVPVAAVATSTAEWVVSDASGHAIATLPPGGPGLIAIENVAPVEPGSDFGPGIRAPLDVIAGLSPGLRSRVFAVIAGTDGSVQLRVLPSGIVDLCQPDQLIEKLAHVDTWFADVDDTKLATLNVCVPDSPVATRLP
jgi:cell division protein FtsQ